MKNKVTIVQRRLTHYRVPFFESLRKMLGEHGVELQLLIGDGTKEERKKKDTGEITWATWLPTRYILNNKLCWQPVHKYLSDTDLVIVTQENALLANHLMIWGPRNFRLAFWGHGANLQSQHPAGLSERYKRWIAKRVDWWFPYTKLSADLVLASGFPKTQMTIVNNSIDTSSSRRQIKTITKTEIQTLKSSVGFKEGPVGVYIGSLYANKRLDFLFAAAEEIRNAIGVFNLLIIGDGPERHLAQSFCENNSWAYWAGTPHGRDKILHIACAEVMLNPGSVGLSILDSFICQVPLLTTDCGSHGPEIAYLANKINGVMTSNHIEDYVNTSVKLLQSSATLTSLQKGCADSSELFTLEEMVNNFAGGISKALNSEFGVQNGTK